MPEGEGYTARTASPRDDPVPSCRERQQPPLGTSAEHEVRSLSPRDLTDPVGAFSVWRHNYPSSGACRVALTGDLLDGGLGAGDVLESISYDGEV